MAREFLASHHAKAGRILHSLDNRLAEVAEGNRAHFSPHGITPGRQDLGMVNGLASAQSGCWQCHGSKVAFEGTDGSCTACHSRHDFSPRRARQPENCGKCHLGSLLESALLAPR